MKRNSVDMQIAVNGFVCRKCVGLLCQPETERIARRNESKQEEFQVWAQAKRVFDHSSLNMKSSGNKLLFGERR